MVETTDWATALPQGSFRGVPFWFEQDGRESGRRLVVHDFPLAEAPLVEDMGKRATRYRLTAYVMNPGTAQALWSVCTAPGLGILTSPTHGTVQARCETISEDHAKDKLGYVAFTLSFVVDGLSLASFSLVDAAASLLGKLEGFFNLLPGAVWQQLDRVGSIPMIEDQATVSLRSAIDTVRGAAMSIALRPDVARDIYASLDNAWTVSRSPVPQTFTAVRALTDTLRSIVISTAPDVSLTVAMSLTTVPDRGRQPLGRTRGRARRFGDAVDLAVAAAATAVVVRQSALIVWTSRDEALQARDRIRSTVDALAAPVGASLGEPVYAALADMRSETVRILTERLTTLKPVIRIDTGISLPSSRLSYDLYGTPWRGREIVIRNNTSTPALLPTTLEVLSP